MSWVRPRRWRVSCRRDPRLQCIRLPHCARSKTQVQSRRMKRSIGIYNLHLRAMGGGEKLALTLAEHLSLRHDVSVFCAEVVDASSLENFFEVDLSRVKILPLNGAGTLPKLVAKLRGNSATATSRHHYDQLRQLNLDLFINNSYGSDLVCPAARGIFMCMFPHAHTNVDSYQTIVAISEYSAQWIGRRWKRTSDVVYPPCDDMGPAQTKQKIILHVGRFISDSDADERHHKRQELLLAALKQMTELHSEGWELHFAGSVSSDKSFANSLVDAARELPVVFHFNATREQLRELYRAAAIYWHATGYGTHAGEHPGKQEHFGISTIEAMSAGA